MARSTQVTEATETPSNGLPTRTGVSQGIPSKSGRSTTSYAVWAPVVAELRDALGESWEYKDVANVQTLSQGLRREFGILAATRGLVKTGDRKGYGTLYIEYPSVRHDDGSLTPDEEEVAAIKIKYAK